MIPLQPDARVAAFASASAASEPAARVPAPWQTLMTRGDESSGGWAMQLSPAGSVRFIAYGTSSSATTASLTMTTSIPKGTVALPSTGSGSGSSSSKAPPAASSDPPAAPGTTAALSPAPAPDSLPSELSVALRAPQPATAGGYIQVRMFTLRWVCAYVSVGLFTPSTACTCVPDRRRHR
jgi:hypothetical protein